MAIKNISQYVSTGTGEDKVLLAWDMNLEAHRSLAPRNLFASEYNMGFGTSNPLHALHVLRNGAASLKVESDTGDALLLVDSASGSRWPAVGWDRSGVRKFTAGLQEDDTWAIAVGSDPNTEPSIEIDSEGVVGFPKGVTIPEGADLKTIGGSYEFSPRNHSNNADLPGNYARIGQYVRIGNIVFFSAFVARTGGATPTSSATFTIPLPIASAKTVGLAAGFQKDQMPQLIAAYIPGSVSHAIIHADPSTITVGSSVFISGWYPIAE